MKETWQTKAETAATYSKRYLEGALVLDEAQLDKGRILHLPTLALAGHGLEMMLKACFYLNQVDPPRSGRAGHDVVSLWKTDTCEPVRGCLFANSVIVAAEDRDNPRYRGVPDTDEILAMIEEHVVELGTLHGERGYPLRYGAQADRTAPRTPFLVRSLWRVADDLVKRPSDFELRRFRGER